MKSKSYQLFLEALHKKVPNKKELIQQLTDLLCMEKETVYRRLRQEVVFSFQEMEVIARKYQISLDEIIGSQSNKDMIFYLLDYDFINTSEEHLETTKRQLEFIKRIQNDPHSEVGFAFNTLPLTLVKSNEHRNIYHFALYKWMYQYGTYTQLPPFKDFILPEQLLEFNDIYRQRIMHANYTYYVLDERMISSFIRDIIYFKAIGYITEEETKKLKTELLEWLKEMEELTLTGTFNTGKRVDFFITRMTIESSYSYIKSENYNVTYLKLFNLNDAISANPQTCIPRIKEWLQSLKKSSSQISVSGELQRIQYFHQQREIINQL